MENNIMAEKKVTSKKVAKKPRKKRKLKPVTPRSQIKSALRQMFMKSREHKVAIKRADATCEMCGRKRSVAKGREVKINVHHLTPVDWNPLIDEIHRTLLCDVDRLQILCKECHEKLHEERGNGFVK